MSMDELGQVVPCSANMQHGECDVCSAELQQASITMQHRCQIHSICWACVEDNCLRHLAATRTPKCPFCTQLLSPMEIQFLETRLEGWKAAQAAEGASEGQAKTSRPKKRRARPRSNQHPGRAMLGQARRPNKGRLKVCRRLPRHPRRLHQSKPALTVSTKRTGPAT